MDMRTGGFGWSDVCVAHTLPTVICIKVLLFLPMPSTSLSMQSQLEGVTYLLQCLCAMLSGITSHTDILLGLISELI